MWAFLTAALGAVMQLVTAGRWKALAIVLVAGSSAGLGWAGKTYVDKKHDAGMAAVETNTTTIQAVKETQGKVVTSIQVMENNLQTITTMMRDVSDTMKRVDETNRDMQRTVVDIYRDVYQIKLKQNESGG